MKMIQNKMADTKYTPPPIPGYRFFSNYIRVFPGSTEPNTVESLTKQVMERLDVPEQDVIVIPFHPVEGGHVWFAGYVTEAHREVVDDYVDRVLAMEKEAARRFRTV